MKAAKNIDGIKNDSNNNCSKLNFLQKLGGHISLSPPGVELGAPKIAVFEILWCTGMGK